MCIPNSIQNTMLNVLTTIGRLHIIVLTVYNRYCNNIRLIILGLNEIKLAIVHTVKIFLELKECLNK